MNFWERIKALRGGKEKALNLTHGELGERAAKKHLRRLGLKFLTANYRSKRGEIDLVFGDGDCRVFVEVRGGWSEDGVRRAATVNAQRGRLLSKRALDYLNRLKQPPVKIRFDIVEVLLTDGAVRE